MSSWWEELFVAPGWQSVQFAWDSVEDADEQTDRIERALRLEPAMQVLDVPCGTGRIASRLAERGYDVVGVDATEAFLDAGRGRADGVRYDRADMRDLPYETAFDAALCFWGSFGYFDDAGNLAQARSAARALRPGGRYLIDVPTLETILPRFRDRYWFEVEGTVVVQETSYRVGEGRVETTWTFLRDGRREHVTSSVRTYSLKELTDLLIEAGFQAFEALDDELEPFELGSHRLWLVATR